MKQQHNKIKQDILSSFFQKKDLKQIMARIKSNIDFGNKDEKEIIEELKEGYKSCIKEKEKPLFTFKETFRFSTKESYIKALVNFLKDDIKEKTIVDATCGIGKAVIGLSEIAKEAIGIEIDPIRAILAEQNLKYYGITNARIINDDTTSDASKKLLEKADVIFVDPERIANAKVRNIHENAPSIDFFIQNYKHKKLIYEISPRIDLESLPENASIILFSYHKRHARTILLFNFFEQRKIICLNENGELIEGNKINVFDYSDFDLNETYREKYIVDIDETIEKAGLLEKLSDYELNDIYKDEKILFSLSDKKIIVPFCDTRKIILESINEKDIKEEIRKNKIGKIVLKYAVPSELYSTEAKKFASKGDNRAYLYKIKGKYLLCLE